MVRTNNINSKPTNSSITSLVRLEANWSVNNSLLNANHKQLQTHVQYSKGFIPYVLVPGKTDIVDEG